MCVLTGTQHCPRSRTGEAIRWLCAARLRSLAATDAVNQRRETHHRNTSAAPLVGPLPPATMEAAIGAHVRGRAWILREAESTQYCERLECRKTEFLFGTKRLDRTKNSRQRRLVREDLPLRTPRRGCGKSEPSLEEMNLGYRTPYAASATAPAKDGFGRFHGQLTLRC